MKRLLLVILSYLTAAFAIAVAAVVLSYRAPIRFQVKTDYGISLSDSGCNIRSNQIVFARAYAIDISGEGWSKKKHWCDRCKKSYMGGFHGNILVDSSGQILSPSDCIPAK